MANTSTKFNRPLTLFAAAITLLAVVVYLFVPTTFGAIVTMWLLLSNPIGIAVGHCALGRDEDKRQ